MSILVPFNGANYIIPTPGETGWGSNLDSFFVAIGAGCLQKIGGSFLLSNEVDFGASFGLKSLYYKAETGTVATTGTLRLASADPGVVFRNNANSGNLALTTNASDQLLFNGTPIGGSGIFTANRAIISNGTGDLAVSPTTSTEIGYVSGVTSAIQTQLNSKATDSLVVHLAGIETITGAKTFTAAQTVFATGTILAPGIAFSSHLDSGLAFSTSYTAIVNGGLAPAIFSDLQTTFTNGLQSVNFFSTLSSGAGFTFNNAPVRMSTLTASRAMATNSSNNIVSSTTTDTELGFVAGVTSAIQTQINGKYSTTGGTLTGDTTYSSGKGIFWTDSGTNTVKLTAPTTITSTYTLKWPVAQGASNQYLTNDGSGNLSWTNAAGTGTVNSGTQFQLAYYATSTNVVSGLTLITASRALVSDTNGLPVAATTTTTEVQGLHSLTASRAIATDGSGILTASATTASELGFVSGVTSSIQTQLNGMAVLAASSNIFTGTFLEIDNGSNGTTEIDVRNSGAGTSALAKFVGSNGTSAFDLIQYGTNFSGTLYGVALANTTKLEARAGNTALFINTTATTMPMYIGTNNTRAMTISGSTQAVSLRGTQTNDNATAGDVGETVLGNQTTFTNFPTSTQWGDLTSISLTAGDWLVWGIYEFLGNGGTTTEFQIAITTTSGNSTTGFTNGLNNFQYRGPTSFTGTNDASISTGAVRFSLSATTTVYLKYEATYSSTAPTASGNIRALRIR